MAEELSGAVSLRADLILMAASRVFFEAVLSEASKGFTTTAMARTSVRYAIELAAEVDRQMAELRRAVKGNGA
jgi:hypothetical protein